ncbi:hypothetical protein ES703_79541 [subsurface metagenome]
MEELEILLLEHYMSKLADSFTKQEMDEFLFLLVKQGLELRKEKMGVKP